MKKTVLTCLAALLAASGVFAQSSIKSSELLTLQEAARILNMEMKIDEGYFDKPESGGGLRTVYETTATEHLYLFQISVKPNAERSYKAIRQMYENDESVIQVKGLGHWACILVKPVFSLYIFHGEYFVNISLSRIGRNPLRNEEEEIIWRTEKVKEAGKLAVGRL